MRHTSPPADSSSLIHDTVYRRLRRRAVRWMHALDDRLTRIGHGRRRLLFEAGSPMNAAILRPLYERLRRDPRLELYFTALPGAWRPQEIFARAGVDGRIIPQDKVRWMKVDAYLNADFWDMTWMHRRTRRIHLFHGVAGKYGLDAPVEIAPIVATFDCLMFPNADRRTRYIEAGLTTDDDLMAPLVGYPKVDCLVDGSLDRAAIARSLALDPGVPTIIYAPTWSPYSSLNTMGEEIIERIAAEGLQIIVKLHDRSYDARERASGGVDWATRLKRFESHPLVRLARGPDASPSLAVSDAMISDHSSIAFEYMLLDRPVVVIDCPELIAKAGISADKVRRLRAASDVVSDVSHVTQAVISALRQPELRSEQRRVAAAELFYKPGTATDRAVALVYRILELPALAETSAPLEPSRSFAPGG